MISAVRVVQGIGDTGGLIKAIVAIRGLGARQVSDASDPVERVVDSHIVVHGEKLYNIVMQL